MRVLLSPGASLTAHGAAAAAALAGDARGVTDLTRVGIRNLRRRQSKAEVHALRKALLGLGPGQDLGPRDPSDSVVAYVCEGRYLGAAVSTPSAGRGAAADAVGVDVVAVTDHANLTWDSPLTGPNDDSLGPRFPVTAGLYEPAAVTSLLGTMLVVHEGVLAGVWDESDPTPFESRVLSGGFLEEGREFAAVSAELAPVAILAAHLGFRVAAAVVVSTG
ncbi:MAG: phosphorylase family protein [Thermoleophilia bacterium]